MGKLTSALGTNLREYTECRKGLTPLRAKVREAETRAAEAVKEDVQLTMKKGGEEKMVQVVRQTREVEKPIGVRRISVLLREAALYALARKETFDSSFESKLSSLVEEELRTCKRSKNCLRVLEKKVKG